MKLVLEKRSDWNKQFRPFSVEPNVFDQTYYFPIGTFKFVKEFNEKFASQVFPENLDNFKWSSYARFIGNDLLNSDYILLPAAEIARLKYQILGQFGDDCKIFVRPDSGAKPFDGQILDITELNYFSSMFGGELTVISKPKKILGEWRFAVKDNGTILGVSLYKYQDNVVYVEACPPEMRNFVSGICIKMVDKPAGAFTVDVAQLTDMTFKIIEINSLHHSGLYEMKPEPIINYISSL